jgi:hypothetical protein
VHRGQAVALGKQQAFADAVAAHGFGPDDWDRRIYPVVKTLPLDQIMAATDYAISHASRVRSGKSQPHPRHWIALIDAGA